MKEKRKTRAGLPALNCLPCDIAQMNIRNEVNRNRRQATQVPEFFCKKNLGGLTSRVKTPNINFRRKLLISLNTYLIY